MSVATLPFPLEGLRGGAAAFTDPQQTNQNKRAKDAEDNHNYTSENSCVVVSTCVHTWRDITQLFAHYKTCAICSRPILSVCRLPSFLIVYIPLLFCVWLFLPHYFSLVHSALMRPASKCELIPVTMLIISFLLFLISLTSTYVVF